jgi:hypothetical protein
MKHVLISLSLVAALSASVLAISCPVGYESACQRFVGCKCIPVTCYFDYQNYPYGAVVTTWSKYQVCLPDSCSNYTIQHTCSNVNGSYGYWTPPVSGLGSGSVFCNELSCNYGGDE